MDGSYATWSIIFVVYLKNGYEIFYGINTIIMVKCVIIVIQQLFVYVKIND